MDILQELGINPDEITDTITERAAQIIAKRVGNELEKKLIANAEAIVGTKVNEIVEKVLTDTFQPVTTWGEPKGKPTTIRDMFEKGIQSWWNTKVDSSGKPDNSSYHAKTTRAEYYASQVISSVIDKELRSELSKYIAEGKAKVKEAMATAVADQISRYWK